MLVLLRVTIGWHFFTEGSDKYSAGNWDAKPFFANARGPVGEQFRRLVWDWDGAIRLDLDKTQIHLATFRDRVIGHYGFDAKQKAAAQGNYAKAIEQFKWVISENEGDIEEYNLGRSRIEKNEADFRRNRVASLAGQTDAIRAEWTQKVSPTLKQMDEIWKTNELSQNQLATLDQSQKRPPLKLGVPRTQLMDTSVLNQFVPYFDMAIGICLIFGLLTPVAALAAAGFLGSVFMSQYPPTTGPSSTMYQLIEGVSCLVLAGTGAGRFGGLDFFFHIIICKLWPNAGGK